jgi:polyisoprenoid-binding protein YceI
MFSSYFLEVRPVSTVMSPNILTGIYAIDPVQSRIGFVARSAKVAKVRGSFNEFRGTGYYDAAEPTRSQLEVTIDVRTIDTGNAKRDAHLRSKDYLAVDRHPEVKYVSTAVERINDRHYRVTGDLTIKGFTHPVTVDFEITGATDDAHGDQAPRLAGTAVINRKNWGIKWNSVFDVFIGEQVTLELEVSPIRTAVDA